MATYRRNATRLMADDPGGDGQEIQYMQDDGGGYIPAPQPNYSGYNRYSGNNSGDMIRNDRDFAYGRGDELFQNSKDRSANEGNLRGYYRGYADEVYDGMIGGRGGYTPDEQRDIIGRGDLDAGMTTDQEYGDNYLSDGERDAVAGRPWDRAQFFNPDEMTRQQNESSGYQRDAVNGLERGMNESLSDRLGLSDDYGRNVDSTLGSMESRTRGAYDPAALRANEGSLNRIRMTPQEEQDIVTKSGVSAGKRYQGEIGEIDKKARAAGIDPIGAAALRGRYVRNSAADAADAMTGARVQASNARSGREATAEGIRMGGEKTAADIGTGVELSLGDRRLRANDTREGMRLDTERDISNRRAGIAKTIGDARLGSEQQINAQQRQQNQYNATTGTDMATGIDRDSSSRALTLAQNRQATARGNQATRFGQNMDRSQAIAQRTGQVAQARRDDAKEGRQYLQNQAGVANQNQQNEYNRQSDIYGTQGQLGQAPTRNQMQKDLQPKWWEKSIAAAVGAASKASGGA